MLIEDCSMSIEPSLQTEWSEGICLIASRAPIGITENTQIFNAREVHDRESGDDHLSILLDRDDALFCDIQEFAKHFHDVSCALSLRCRLAQDRLRLRQRLLERPRRAVFLAAQGLAD